MPSPARVPVQVTGMLVVPENVHTGSPPFLKCGLEAKATETVSTSRSSAVNTAISIRRMVDLLLAVRVHIDARPSSPVLSCRCRDTLSFTWGGWLRSRITQRRSTTTIHTYSGEG